MSEIQDRRKFLAAVGAAVLSTQTSARAQPPADPDFRLPPMGAVVAGVRENVAHMDDDHPTFRSYRKAVLAMRELDKTDPKSPLGWAFQANMHGAPAASGGHDGWRWCRHGNWWFLPWHRGYVYFFERIVRKMSGDAAFSLPYWAWDAPGQNALPEPFQKERHAAGLNPLYDASRVVANRGQSLRPPTSSGSFFKDWTAASKMSRFTTPVLEQSYGGARQKKSVLPARPVSTRDHGVMESMAHDFLHVAVGGRMGTASTAAQDPIFWLHHANVDRLWNRWLDDRDHVVPSEQEWYEQEFPYYDEDGKRVALTVSAIMGLSGLRYRYEDERQRMFVAGAAPPQQKDKPVEPTVVGVASVQPVLNLGTTPFTKSFAFAAEAKPVMVAAFGAAPGSGAEPPAVLLRVEGIQPPKTADIVYEVFVTKAGEKAGQRHYVGPISFFGRTAGDHDHGHGEGGFTQGFDVTEVVQRLKTANGNVIPELEVTIVPHSTAGVTDEELAKQNVNIPIANVTLKLVTDGKK